MKDLVDFEPGEQMLLVAPHFPEHLRNYLKKHGFDIFSWRTVLAGSAFCLTLDKQAGLESEADRVAAHLLLTEPDFLFMNMTDRRTRHCS